MNTIVTPYNCFNILMFSFVLLNFKNTKTLTFDCYVFLILTLLADFVKFEEQISIL